MSFSTICRSKFFVTIIANRKNLKTFVKRNIFYFYKLLMTNILKVKIFLFNRLLTHDKMIL